MFVCVTIMTLPKIRLSFFCSFSAVFVLQIWQCQVDQVAEMDEHVVHQTENMTTIEASAVSQQVQ